MDVDPEEFARPIAFSTPSIDEGDVAAVVNALRSRWITSGDECSAFEQELSEYLGVDAVVVSSCTSALEIACAWLGLRPGNKVGVPVWTFASTALAPFHTGAEIVLLDVEPDTLNLSAESLERALDDGLDAVIPVHFGGVPVSEEIHALAAEHGVPLLEDAAHALGATDHRGRLAGQGSVGACFSFYANKNLTTGEGGALATEDPGLAEFARFYRLHGLSRDARAREIPDGSPLYDLVMPGIKANLSDVLAALGRSQLLRFGETQAKRRALVERYRKNLSESAIEAVPAAAVSGSADNLMVIVLPEHVDRGRIVQALSLQHVGTSVHFQPLHHFGWFKAHAALAPGGAPTADAIAGRVLSLPLHPDLTAEDVDRVCELLARAVRR